jgi:short-subunit dehydrogenase
VRGTALVLAARDEAALEAAAAVCRTRGADVLTVPTDIVDPAQNRALVECALERFGHIDVWIGAASVTAYGTVADTPDDVYRRTLATNLQAPIEGVRAVLPHFLERGRGRIVLLGSLYSLVSSPYMSAYVAGKHGLLGFARSLRQEMLGSRIDVRIVLPATIDTAIFQRAANSTGRRPHPLPPVVSPRRAGRVVARASRGRGPREAVVGRVQKAAVALQWTAPRAYDRGARVAMDTLGLRGTDIPATPGAVLEPAHDTGAVAGGWRSGRTRLLGLTALAVLGLGLGLWVRAGQRGRKPSDCVVSSATRMPQR